MIEARLHTDGSGEERERIAARNKKLQERFLEKLGNPMFVVLDPRTEEVLGKLDRAVFDASAFADFLKTSKARMAAASP